MQEEKTVHILGTEYKVQYHTSKEDDLIKECDGYCDKTSHTIVVSKKPATCDLDDYTVYQKKVLRHEIIHAFLFESGFQAEVNWLAKDQEHPEMMVDWFAIQFPKMIEAFKEADAL